MIIVGKTMVIFKIAPADMEKIAAIEGAVKGIKSGEFKDLKKEPIGFGIEIIKAAFLIPEKEEGALEKLTDELKGLPYVDNVEVAGMTLV